MSRDFILVLSGGVVALVTTFVVLFVMDWVYRRDAVKQSAAPTPAPKPVPAKPIAPVKVETAPPPKPIATAKVETAPPPKPIAPVKTEPLPQPAPVKIEPAPPVIAVTEPVDDPMIPPPESMSKG
jgi:protein TonB